MQEAASDSSKMVSEDGGRSETKKHCTSPGVESLRTWNNFEVVSAKWPGPLTALGRSRASGGRAKASLAGHALLHRPSAARALQAVMLRCAVADVVWSQEAPVVHTTPTTRACCIASLIQGLLFLHLL
jgi:hypothetical protein